MDSATNILSNLTEVIRNTDPIVYVVLGTALLGIGIVLIVRGAHSDRDASASDKSLDAKVFVAILVFALALVLFGTETARITGIGMLVVTVSAAWFRRGRIGTQGATRRDKGSFKITFKGVEWERSWDSNTAEPQDDRTA